jgi:hypothetical protein
MQSYLSARRTSYPMDREPGSIQPAPRFRELSRGVRSESYAQSSSNRRRPPSRRPGYDYQTPKARPSTGPALMHDIGGDRPRGFRRVISVIRVKVMEDANNRSVRHG